MLEHELRAHVGLAAGIPRRLKWPDVLVSRPNPDLAEFVRLVDIHVTPHMARLRYVRLHAFAGQQGASEAILTAVDRHPVRALLRRFSFSRAPFSPCSHRRVHHRL